MKRYTERRGWIAAAAFAALALIPGARGDDILRTLGYTSCAVNPDISLQRADITYNASNKTVTFDVAGTSNKVQNVTAVLNVTAYGQNVYSNSFNPCSPATSIPMLCPVPVGTFAARGTQQIPAQFADAVPAIAFSIPDIAAMATLELRTLDTGRDVACVQSQVTNGKTASVPAISYVAAGVAGAALVMTGISAVGAAVASGGGSAAAGSSAGMGTVSPSFVEVFGYFQGIAINGMLSVNYPQVYRSFTSNFAFSTGLVPWNTLQQAIDDFRGSTGGDLTTQSVKHLRETTLIFPDGSMSAASNSTDAARVKRAVEHIILLARQIETSVNTTAPGSSGNSTEAPSQLSETVTGIQAYVQQLQIPSANTFMTVLLVVAIAIAATAIGILLFKIILECWALFGNFPKSLTGFRKHYWASIGRTITSLIFLLYGIWVLYCIFQFTHGDSWAAKTLAGVTLAIFTALLFGFSFKIWWTARKLRKEEGDASGLYEKKDVWIKFSIFYESYRKSAWWAFVPVIVYMLTKGIVVAVGDGHGMAQTAALLIVEGIMLILLIWSRPYERKSGNVINIAIQVVRVLSVICILVFVQELGVAQTTSTVAGVVLIAVQGGLTGILAILIAWNAINACCKANPHRQRRKEMEKLRDMDNLTPLDARNSLLMDRPKTGMESSSTFAVANMPDDKKSISSRDSSPERYLGTEPGKDRLAVSGGGVMGAFRPLTPQPYGDDGRTGLLASAAPISTSRQPTVPAMGNYGQGGYGGYSQGYGGYGPSSRGGY